MAILRNRKIMKKCVSIFKHYMYYRKVKYEKNRRASIYHQNQVRNSVISNQSSKATDLSYPLMSLAFTAWRAFSVKRANIGHIVDRFRQFGDKKIMRNFFGKWHRNYHEKTNTVHEGPGMKSIDLNYSLSQYLPRDSQNFQTNPSRERFETKYLLSGSFNFSTEKTDPDPNESFNRNKDYWIQKMKENEEFLIKITERDSEYNTLRKKTENSLLDNRPYYF